MTKVYVVSHVTVLPTEDQPGAHEIQGVFSTREAAAATCRTEADAIVTFEVDRDCTDEHTFEVEHPTLGSGPQMITC